MVRAGLSTSMMGVCPVATNRILSHKGLRHFDHASNPDIHYFRNRQFLDKPWMSTIFLDSCTAIIADGELNLLYGCRDAACFPQIPNAA
jgi:hypothetical protein